MGARVEDTEDPLHREATLSRLHSLVIRKDQENPSSMRDMGQKIMGKVVAEWEWWKPGSILR
jgi:hypothetical protein